MTIIAFPPVEEADENGLLAFGGDLEVASLQLAYSNGIFPWPISSNYPLAWFSPDPRGILHFDDLHVSRSLKKAIRAKPWQVTFNQRFNDVIYHCAQFHSANPHQQGTWITQDIIDAYVQFHRAGHAYSVEVWLEQELVGGLYGVRIGQAVSGESMFHYESNASKIAVLALMKYLSLNQIHWLDTQMVTPVMATLGAKEIDRADFLELLSKGHAQAADELFSKAPSFNNIELLSF